MLIIKTIIQPLTCRICNFCIIHWNNGRTKTYALRKSLGKRNKQEATTYNRMEKTRTSSTTIEEMLITTNLAFSSYRTTVNHHELKRDPVPLHLREIVKFWQEETFSCSLILLFTSVVIKCLFLSYLLCHLFLFSYPGANSIKKLQV